MKRFFPVLAVVVCVLVAAVAVAVYRAPLWVADQRIHLHLFFEHIQSEYVEVDGNRIHYYEALPQAGAGSEEHGPLLLIHGLGGRSEDWSPMMPAFAAHGFHVYALDLLGYGRSAKPDIDYSIAGQAKLAADFLQAVHADRADVVGWSMGGWVALKLAIDRPALVDRLVVMDSAGIYFLAAFDASLFTPTDQPGLARLVAKLSPAPIALPGFIAEDALRKLRANAWVVQRSLRSMTGGSDLLDFQLQRIQSPTLIVWGAHDDLIPLASGEAMHRKIAGSDLLVIQGCGHLAPAECTRPVLKGTLDFLSATPAPQDRQQSVPGH